MIGALYHPTETELQAHRRRQSFRQSIADAAAALKEKKTGAHQPRDAAPEAVAAQPDPPAAEVVRRPFEVVVLGPMTKAPWFYIEGVRVLAPLRVTEIMEVVCEFYGVDMNDMTSARRTAIIVKPRQVAMYLAKVMTGRSLPEIGRRFGGRDHTTVLHAIRRIGAKVELNPDAPEMFDAELAETITSLRSAIEARRE